MTNSILHYFVDTNLFLQCRQLEQLDWSPWAMFEEVRMIVSGPVLREIDYLKNKGNDRASRRARDTSAMFRKMLDKGHKLVHTGNPRVVLSVELHHQYSKDLQHRLNYQERDDQLIGIVYEFAQRNQTSEVRLLTNDTTPLYTARGLCLTADLILEEWLLPPEATKLEKEVATLRSENARLKKAEPSFTIRCEDESGSEAKRYHTSYTWFEPLTDEQIDELMQRLRDCFPLETDFGPREPAERAVKQTVLDNLLGIREVFTPATDQEIAKYCDEAYPKWLKDCEEVLRNHHRALQRHTPMLEVSFLAANVGTRPATDALITIEAHGNFRIRPPPYDDQDEALPRELPPPPGAPSGQWRWTLGGFDPVGALRNLDVDAIARSLQGSPVLAPDLGGIVDHPSLHDLKPSRDRNAFYYKPDRPAQPQSAFSIECAQWRHDDGEEGFFVEIHVPTDQEGAKGALVCRIQAGNLSKSASKTIPVEIEITHVSAFESARDMVAALLGS